MRSTVSVPVAAALLVGWNSTATVQMAPAPSVPVHVFCVRTNGGATAIVIVLNAYVVVLLTVTDCAGVDWPTFAAANVNCAGLTCSPVASCAVPPSEIEAGATPSVEEETVRIAATPPASDGVKTTCTVQLLPLFSVAPHVVAPVEKLLAAAPVIEKPMLAMGDPPALLTVSVCGALGTPGCWLVKDRLVGLMLKAGGTSPVPAKATY